jgi:transcriptional regulator with XRE-family HTH domain
MRKLGLSVAELAQMIGVSPAKVSQAIRGELIDVETVTKLSQWLGVHPCSLINAESMPEDELASQIAVLIEQAPEVAEIFRAAVLLINNGTASPELVEDIVIYVSYKLRRRLPTVFPRKQKR